MITTQREIKHYEKKAGGNGTIHVEHLLPPEILKEQVLMYAKVSVDVNSSIGYHKHEGDGESYYILQGKAAYNDNGKIIELEVGACTFTPSGSSHGIENIANEPLVFMAIILKDNTED